MINFMLMLQLHLVLRVRFSLGISLSLWLSIDIARQILTVKMGANDKVSVRFRAMFSVKSNVRDREDLLLVLRLWVSLVLVLGFELGLGHRLLLTLGLV